MVFIPTIKDAGKFLGCRAADQQTGEGSLEDGWKLSITCKNIILIQHILVKIEFVTLLDVPQAILSLGFSLNGSNIKEGDDVYFECSVRSNPRPYKISWRRNVSDFSQLTHIRLKIIDIFFYFSIGKAFDAQRSGGSHCQ